MSSLRTSEAPFRRLIDAVAAFEQLPRWSYKDQEYSAGELLEGLILTESSGDPMARRYEPAHDAPGRKDQGSDPDQLAHDDGRFEDDASYGLGQVMGTTFKALLHVDRPVKIDYSILYRPLFGLAALIETLKGELRAVYLMSPMASDSERIVRALARYNGGPTGDTLVAGPPPALPQLRTQAYVDRVAANAKKAHEDRQASGWKVA
jgi:hypothetical protein